MATRTRLLSLAAGVGVAVLVSGCTSSVGGHGAHGPSTPRSTPAAVAAGTATPTSPSASSPPATATVTVTAPAPPTVAPATTVNSQPGIFVGTWTGHGRGLVVSADGTATVTYRTYTFCTQPPKQPCDRLSGNVITDGGHVTLRTEKVVTANHMSTLTAIVLTSADPRIHPGTAQTFTLSGDIITSADYSSFCDAKASGQCGA